MKRIVEHAFEVEGYQCEIVATTQGHRCGYIEVTESNMLYGQSDSDYESSIHKLSVHGGVTYTYLDESKKTFRIGFDCAHLYDAKDPDILKQHGIDEDKAREMLGRSFYFPDIEYTIKTKEYCIEELKSLARQLKTFERREHDTGV